MATTARLGDPLRADASAGDAQIASHYAAHLLADLGVACAPLIEIPHPAQLWARSGLMQLCGRSDGAAQMCPVPLAACAEAALSAFAQLSRCAALQRQSGAQLLAERAALMQLQRADRMSAGGACRLLETRDGGIALSLPRADDWALLPAWLECATDIAAGDWAALAERLAQYPRAVLLARAQELGLAAALDEDGETPMPGWFSLRAGSAFTGAAARATRPPRVVELASLWAGPLCGHLLQQAGAEVIKLESVQRPDGARRGSAAFFDLLNAGKRSVALDFNSAAGRAQLRELLLRADIVIEGSRPRALRQLGIVAEQLLAEHPRLSWIAISAYGREPQNEQRIGYGDDAAVGAGLSAVQARACGEQLLVGDAIADPLTGLHAALSAWASYADGGGRLLALSLCDVVRHLIGFARPATPEAWRLRYREWTQQLQAGDLRRPQARAVTAAAATFGADTAAVLRDWNVAC